MGLSEVSRRRQGTSTGYRFGNPGAVEGFDGHGYVFGPNGPSSSHAAVP